MNTYTASEIRTGLQVQSLNTFHNLITNQEIYLSWLLKDANSSLKTIELPNSGSVENNSGFGSPTWTESYDIDPYSGLFYHLAITTIKITLIHCRVRQYLLNKALFKELVSSDHKLNSVLWSLFLKK
jgi:hypothetical protein